MEKEEADAEELSEKRKGYKRRQVSDIGWGVGICYTKESKKELRAPFIEFYDDEREECLTLPLATWGSIVGIARLIWLLAGEFVRLIIEEKIEAEQSEKDGGSGKNENEKI